MLQKNLHYRQQLQKSSNSLHVFRFFQRCQHHNHRVQSMFVIIDQKKQKFIFISVTPLYRAYHRNFHVQSFSKTLNFAIRLRTVKSMMLPVALFMAYRIQYFCFLYNQKIKLYIFFLNYPSLKETGYVLFASHDTLACRLRQKIIFNFQFLI